jgi:protein-S-isoprenylcysteine O-methyltransferase Ste14
MASSSTVHPARRISAVLGTIVFFFLAPGFVAGLVPRWITHWRYPAPFPGLRGIQAVGCLLISAALVTLIECFSRFALQGNGTPAPVFPTRTLVIKGLYRFVRNPMYLSVLAIILGQVLLFSSLDLLEYAMFCWFAFHAFVLVYEEPALRRSFGHQYETYCANVRRWIPRFTPWSL